MASDPHLSHRLADDRLELLRRRTTRIAEIDLVMLADELAALLGDERVQARNRRPLSAVWTHVQTCAARPSA
jgi:hypothetical protein